VEVEAQQKLSQKFNGGTGGNFSRHCQRLTVRGGIWREKIAATARISITKSFTSQQQTS
jgi:hypothetical protein